MEGLFGSSNAKPTNVEVKVNNAAAKNVVNTAGKTLKNSLATAQSVKEALLTVSTQLKDAANTLNSNKAGVANAAAETVKANLPVAGGVFTQMGGSPATAALIGGMPKSVIAGGARRAVEEGVRQLKKLSVAAREGADAINGGMRMVAKGAEYVAKNAKRVDMARVNRALTGAGRIANNNVPSNINVNVESNLNEEVNSTVSANASQVANMAAGFANNMRRNSRRNRKNGGFANNMRFANNRRNSRSRRNSRKNGGFANNMRRNSRKNSRKSGGFLGLF